MARSLTRHGLCLTLTLSLAFGVSGEEARTIRVGPYGNEGFRGQDAAVIQLAVDVVGETGGRVVLTRGEYKVWRGIRLDRVNGIEIVGEPGAKLLFMPAPFATLTETAPRGATKLRVGEVARFYVGAICEVYDGERNFIADVRVTGVEDGVLTLRDPLDAELPAGTGVMVLENCIQGYLIEDIRIAGIEIDMQGDKQPAHPRNHSRHCGVFVSGQANYEQVRAYSRGVSIEDCIIRNAPHRGIAFYSTLDGAVRNCVVEKAHAEAINIDHFCRRFDVTGNTVDAANVGVEVNDGSDLNIAGNTVRNCRIGIKVWRYEPCKMEDANRRNRIAGNTVLGSARNGIWFGRTVTGNTITDNLIDGVGDGGVGIVMTDAGNTLSGNTVRNAPRALSAPGAAR